MLKPSRRSVIRNGSTGIIALLAGCMNPIVESNTPTPVQSPTGTNTPMPSPTSTPRFDPDDLDGFIRPDSEPDPIAPLVCDEYDEFERYGPSKDQIDDGEFKWGNGIDERDQPVAGLRVSDLSFKRGEEVTVALTNLTNGELYMGTGAEYYLQVYTQDGWQDIRGLPDGDGVGYPDVARIIPPRGSFEWSFSLTTDQVFAGHLHEGTLVVCPGLPSGRYRFVYWALPDIQNSLMVSFDLIE